MKRQYIDRAILRQLARRESVLRDVLRSGGTDGWSHLFSHGHAFPTITSCIKEGYLARINGDRYRYEITDLGREHLSQLDLARMSGNA